MKVKYSNFSRKEKLHYVEKQIMIFLSAAFFGLIGYILVTPAIISLSISHLNVYTASSFAMAIVTGLYLFIIFGAVVGLLVAEKVKLYTPYDLERTNKRLFKIRSSLIENETGIDEDVICNDCRLSPDQCKCKEQDN